ncbi:MAG: hypothetical protein V7L05_01995 [Nostoc sp.]|uniref:hypothetical protein n=1 Tax=Nostoc sp. TaxID=1180 RepID=UPI002FF67CEA
MGRDEGDKGDEGDEGEISNDPMPHAQCPMPNAQCPMPNAQCPNYYFSQNLKLKLLPAPRR